MWILRFVVDSLNKKKEYVIIMAIKLLMLITNMIKDVFLLTTHILSMRNVSI